MSWGQTVFTRNIKPNLLDKTSSTRGTLEYKGRKWHCCYAHQIFNCPYNQEGHLCVDLSVIYIDSRWAACGDYTLVNRSRWVWICVWVVPVGVGGVFKDVGVVLFRDNEEEWKSKNKAGVDLLINPASKALIGWLWFGGLEAGHHFRKTDERNPQWETELQQPSMSSCSIPP